MFQSPANVSVGSAVKPAVNISNDQQEDLNLPFDGKAVNAIRFFPGCSILPLKNEDQVNAFLASPAGEGWTLEYKHRFLP